MYFADVVSYFYKPKDDNLGYKIGSLPLWSGCSKQLQTNISNLYTFMQIAITYILVSSKSNIEINLFAIFIIQITAFMGTLSKKGFINNFQWHFIYLLQYAISFLLFYNNKNILNIHNVIIGIIIWALRTKLNVNKFSLWTSVSILIILNKYFKSNTLLILVAVILYNIFNYFGVFFDKKREINHSIIKENKKNDDTNLHEIKIKMKQKTDYNPGQYYNLYIDKEKRPYTPIHIDKSENIVTFYIKDYKNNKISEKICNLSEEMYIHVNGPFGTNYYDKNNDKIIYNNSEINTRNILMFYCGTGITPFYSILKNLNKNTKYNFKVFGSLKNKNENILNDIKQKIFYSTNKLTSKKIKKIVKKYSPLDTTILLCGSESYNNLVSDSIIKEFCVCKW
jgi:NAD(P)H-flavin reductase